MEKNLKLICLIIIFSMIIIAGFFVYQWRQTKEADVLLNEQTEQLPTNLSKSQTYRNTEWGFEFEYPEDWVISREHKHMSYYSQFLLMIDVPVSINDKERFDDVFLVNIVLPEFIRSFDALEKTISKITVAGVEGIKYEYDYQGFPQTDVILPIGEYKMILGTGHGSKQYLDEFDQILSTFKFLK